VPAVATQMAQMSLGTRAAADGGRRGRREMNFTEPHTRPAHLSDKRGGPLSRVTLYLITPVLVLRYNVKFGESPIDPMPFTATSTVTAVLPRGTKIRFDGLTE